LTDWVGARVPDPLPRSPDPGRGDRVPTKESLPIWEAPRRRVCPPRIPGTPWRHRWRPREGSRLLSSLGCEVD